MATPEKKQIDDISQPGTTPAEATSRPIIVSHGPALKDPMVTREAIADESKPVSEEITTQPAVKKVIKPIESGKKQDIEEQAQKPAVEKDEVQHPDVTEEAVVDAVVEQVSDKTKQEAQSKEELEREELVNKLVTEKKYFVPIGQVHKRRNHRIVLAILLIIVLSGVGAVLAVDAGLLVTDVELPFNLIK